MEGRVIIQRRYRRETALCYIVADKFGNTFPLAKNLTKMIDKDHFEVPAWLARKEGLLNKT